MDRRDALKSVATLFALPGFYYSRDKHGPVDEIRPVDTLPFERGTSWPASEGLLGHIYGCPGGTLLQVVVADAFIRKQRILEEIGPSLALVRHLSGPMGSRPLGVSDADAPRGHMLYAVIQGWAKVAVAPSALKVVQQKHQVAAEYGLPEGFFDKDAPNDPS